MSVKLLTIRKPANETLIAPKYINVLVTYPDGTEYVQRVKANWKVRPSNVKDAVREHLGLSKDAEMQLSSGHCSSADEARVAAVEHIISTPVQRNIDEMLRARAAKYDITVISIKPGRKIMLLPSQEIALRALDITPKEFKSFGYHPNGYPEPHIAEFLTKTEEGWVPREPLDLTSPVLKGSEIAETLLAKRARNLPVAVIEHEGRDVLVLPSVPKCAKILGISPKELQKRISTAKEWLDFNHTTQKYESREEEALDWHSEWKISKSDDL